MKKHGAKPFNPNARAVIDEPAPEGLVSEYDHPLFTADQVEWNADRAAQAAQQSQQGRQVALFPSEILEETFSVLLGNGGVSAYIRLVQFITVREQEEDRLEQQLRPATLQQLADYMYLGVDTLKGYIKTFEALQMIGRIPIYLATGGLAGHEYVLFSPDVWQVPDGVDGRYRDFVRRRIPPETRERVFKRDNYRCINCGTGVDLSIDHIIPESQSHDDGEANLQTLCRTCNSEKGAN